MFKRDKESERAKETITIDMKNAQLGTAKCEQGAREIRF